MPALSNKAYFNYGGQGPLPRQSLEAITESWQKIQALGPFSNSVWPYVSSEIVNTRKQLAKLCGVPSHRLALTENVTSGCVLPLLGLPFSKGDRLLIGDCEHPGVVAACKELSRRNNLEIDVLPVQQLRKGVNQQRDTDRSVLSLISKSLTANTRLVVLSHLLWNTGQLMPISLIAELLKNHPRQPFLLVDAAQSFGQIPVESVAASSDIFAFTGHKWACGPEGLGGVAISDRVLNQANPTLIGWRSLKQENTTNTPHAEMFHKDSRRFEIATSCIPLLAGLRCSLQLLEQEGAAEERHKNIQKYSHELWRELNAMDGIELLLEGPPPAGLVSFFMHGDRSPAEVVNLLGKENLWIRDLEEPLCLRACLHITTEHKEVEQLSEAIAKLTNN